ncbi:hypothetical protein ACFW2Y_22355 [Streptomyces sp. NPDC058877]|uniref:DUF7848 domain-containing protein n=1 Tax=unclassified Streptomyces TaxID=2593676 RepID=UPI0036A483AC
MTRVYGYVLHRIRRDPESEPVVSARCLHEGCAWTSAPSATVNPVDDACMGHTGLNPEHARFARQFADVAVVGRLDPT